MNRPLLNLSIFDLIEKFDTANGDVAVALELVKELRHRGTPKAAALNKRALEVLAVNASGRLFQSLLLPELEILCTSFIGIAGVRTSLISVLETRSSVKSKKLLDLLKSQSIQPPLGDELGTNRLLQSNKMPSAILGASNRKEISAETAKGHSDVHRALFFFGLPVDASWIDAEAVRQTMVLKYRPGLSIGTEQARQALEEISSAYLLLAKHMQGRY